MSNESQSPPPLRLKPRLSSAQPVNTPENPTANPSTASTAAHAQVAPPLAPVAPPPLRTVIPAPLPPERVPAPVSPTPVPPPAAEDPGKFKLKPRGATPVAPAAAAAPVMTAASVSTPAMPSAVPASAAVPLVEKPTLPAAALASPAFAAPTAPSLPGRPNMPIAPLPRSAPVAIPTSGQGPRPQGKMVAQNSPETDVARGKFALKLLMALLFVAFVLGGVFAYNLWFSEDSAPAPTPVATKPPVAKPADAQPAASSPDVSSASDSANAAAAPEAVVVDNPQSVPGQQVARAQAAVAAHDAALSQPVDDVLKSATAPASNQSSDTKTAAPVETPAVPAPVAAAVAPARPEPGAAFKSFVVNLKVSGVFQGENARAMINGKMYRLGEVVDSKLGIVFLRLEPEDKRIVFEDSRGAIMSRRY